MARVTGLGIFLAAAGTAVGLLSAGGAEAVHRVAVPTGATLPLVLETTVSSATSRVGDAVLARVAEDVRVGARVVVPEGSEVRGRVRAARPSGRVSGRARLAVAFTHVEIRGHSHALSVRAIDITAPKTHRRDARIVTGTTAAGLVAGALADGKDGAKKGALLGAGAGAGVVLVNKGDEVTLPAGSSWKLRLTRSLFVE